MNQNVIADRVARRFLSYGGYRSTRPIQKREPNWAKWTQADVAKEWQLLLNRVLPDPSLVVDTKIRQTPPDPRRQNARGFIVVSELVDGSKMEGLMEPDWDGNLWSGRWQEVNVDGVSFGMRAGPQNLREHFDKKYLSLLQRYRKTLDGYDVTGHFSDDSAYFWKQEADQKKMVELYAELDPQSQREAYDYYLKTLKRWQSEYPTLKFRAPAFAQFKGA